MVSRRQAAWGESTKETGATVNADEAGVLGIRGNLLDGAARACWCGLLSPAVGYAALIDMVLIAVSA